MYETNPFWKRRNGKLVKVISLSSLAYNEVYQILIENPKYVYIFAAYDTFYRPSTAMYYNFFIYI